MPKIDVSSVPERKGTGYPAQFNAVARARDDVITCSDIDMMSPASDGRFLHKDGTPY